jgi:hypothetical protein
MQQALQIDIYLLSDFDFDHSFEIQPAAFPYSDFLSLEKV